MYILLWWLQCILLLRGIVAKAKTYEMVKDTLFQAKGILEDRNAYAYLFALFDEDNDRLYQDSSRDMEIS